MVFYDLQFVIRNLKNKRVIFNIDLYTRFFKDQYHVFLRLITLTILKRITELKTFNYLLQLKTDKNQVINQ